MAWLVSMIHWAPHEEFPRSFWEGRFRFAFFLGLMFGGDVWAVLSELGAFEVRFKGKPKGQRCQFSG